MDPVYVLLARLEAVPRQLFMQAAGQADLTPARDRLIETVERAVRLRGDGLVERAEPLVQDARRQLAQITAQADNALAERLEEVGQALGGEQGVSVENLGRSVGLGSIAARSSAAPFPQGLSRSQVSTKQRRARDAGEKQQFQVVQTSREQDRPMYTGFHTSKPTAPARPPAFAERVSVAIRESARKDEPQQTRSLEPLQVRQLSAPQTQCQSCQPTQMIVPRGYVACEPQGVQLSEFQQMKLVELVERQNQVLQQQNDEIKALRQQNKRLQVKIEARDNQLAGMRGLLDRLQNPPLTRQPQDLEEIKTQIRSELYESMLANSQMIRSRRQRE